MPSIPIICMVCSASIKEDRFPQHMASVHGGLSQSEAMAQQKNIPTQQAPIVLDKEAPPSPDFMEVAKMLDEKPKPSLPPPAVSKEVGTSTSASVSQQEELKPIKLEYRYSGSCKECRIPVETLVVKVKNQAVAVAFCTKHGQLTEREVVDLNDTILFNNEQEDGSAPIIIGEAKKPGKKYDDHEEHVKLFMKAIKKERGVKKHDK